MSIVDEINSLFHFIPEKVSKVSTDTGRKLTSRKEAAYSRSLVSDPERKDLSHSEWLELCMLRKRLRVDGYCYDFNNLCLEETRDLAISIQTSAAIRCLN